MPARKRKRLYPKPQRARPTRLRQVLWSSSVVGLVALSGWAVYLDYTVRSQFEGKRWAIPARVYARPLEVFVGAPLRASELARELDALGYSHLRAAGRQGSYSRRGERFRVHTRPFDFADSREPARQVALNLGGGVVTSLSQDSSAGPLDLFRLEPVLIGSIHPARHEDRVLVRLQDVPRIVLDALVAVEDRSFYLHSGVDPRGIARAMWANLQAGAIVQGGSTLTQQLAKNFYLTPRRSLWRKFNEALMALMLEWHYEKDEILEAYLNEIYLGQDGKRAIHGFGLASHFYFARPVDELKVHELAMLVGMVKGPSYYNPRKHPDRCRARRNLVLDILYADGLLSEQVHAAARAAPLTVTPRPSGLNNAYPAFLDLVKRQLRRDYAEEDLTSGGLRIFTTLDPAVQHAASTAVSRKLQQLEQGGRLAEGSLQGAVVVSTVEGGEVLAITGGRQAGFAGFNRALDAVRPIGSLVKPAVYLTALQREEEYTLLSPLGDTPLRIATPEGDVWTPRNYDRAFHGEVPLHRALSRSFNVATVRLGFSVGVEPVLKTLRELGVRRPLKPYPSLFLGAAELSPLEVTQMYQTLASGGFYSPLRAIREVLSAQGGKLQRYPLTVHQAADARAVFLVNATLREAAREGTARALQNLLPAGVEVAGKTGTTDDLRDSWFAGFTDDRVAVVWLGLDDNGSTGLTGSSGALRVWANLMGRIATRSLNLVPPDGVEMVAIDQESGLRAGPGCEHQQTMPFVAGSAPQAFAECATSWVSRGVDQLKKLFVE